MLLHANLKSFFHKGIGAILKSRVSLESQGLEWRGCGNSLNENFMDLGTTPLPNSYIDLSRSLEPKPLFTLNEYVCTNFWLVQLPAVVKHESIFSLDNANLSSFSKIGGEPDARMRQMALPWALNYSDGEHGLLGIAELCQFNFTIVAQAAETLLQHNLLVTAG